jgi:hypothetical protein
MATKTKTRVWADPRMEADRVVQDLAKIAFANIFDFAQFRDGRMVDIDHVKARRWLASCGKRVIRCSPRIRRQKLAADS